MIRRLRADEAERLAGLARDIWLRHYPAIISLEQIDYMLNQRYAPDLIRAQLASPDNGWWVAEQDGTLVGFAHVMLMEDQCKLDKLYIDPDHQRRGLGAALLEQAKVWTCKAGRTRLTLQVNRHNSLALSAYRKYGFVTTEARVFDIGGGFVMDDYFMELKLSKPFNNPDAAAIRDLLARIRIIAVVGLSPRPERPSHAVARAMQRSGFRIVPVRPDVDQVLGEKTYARLEQIPYPVDLVDVFRSAEHLPEIVEECLQLNIPALWIQEGIVNEAAANRARAGGIFTVMDRCIWKEYVALQP